MPELTNEEIAATLTESSETGNPVEVVGEYSFENQVISAAKTEVVTISEARLACRIDGTDNDFIIRPMKESAEEYVISAIGREWTNDARAKEAVLLLIQIAYRPEEDVSGNLSNRVVSLIKQINAAI